MVEVPDVDATGSGVAVAEATGALDLYDVENGTDGPNEGAGGAFLPAKVPKVYQNFRKDSVGWVSLVLLGL